MQRSWCLRRAERAGFFTLSILPEEVRRGLLEQWILGGGGTSSFFATESDTLLEFIASRLPDPSHQLTACRFEQATLRANQAVGFTPSDLELPLSRPSSMRYALRRGRYAATATFHGDPHEIIGALMNHRPLPAVSAEATTMLFGPGLERLCRVASPLEVALWRS